MNVLVVAAHPDDEVLGCGGVIAKHSSINDHVYVAILGEGATSRGEKCNNMAFRDEPMELKAAAQKANNILGVKMLEFHDLPDNRMDSLTLLDVVKIVENIVSQFQPEIVYTHHIGDLNIDHQYVHNATVTACRPQPGSSVKRLLFFEIASSTEWQIPYSAPSFQPNWFVDISDTLNMKLESLRAYGGEMREWPHSRSIKALECLARWRGASVGVEAAEAFMLGRNVL